MNIIIVYNVLGITLTDMGEKENKFLKALCMQSYRWSKKTWCWLSAQFSHLFLCYCHWAPVVLHPGLVLNPCASRCWGNCHTQWWFALCASRWREREWKMVVILLYTEIPKSLFLPMSVDPFIWILLSRKLPRNTEMPTTLEEAEKAKRHGKRTCSIFGQWDMRLGQPSNIP